MVFKEIGFIEQWGTGMRKMLNLCASADLPELEFKESGLFFKIIFKKVPPSTKKFGGQKKRMQRTQWIITVSYKSQQVVR